MKKIILASALLLVSGSFLKAQDNSKQASTQQGTMTPEMAAEKEATFALVNLGLSDPQRFQYKQFALNRKYAVKAQKEKAAGSSAKTVAPKSINDKFFDDVTGILTPEQKSKW